MAVDRRFVLRMLAALGTPAACRPNPTVSVPRALVEVGEMYLQAHPEERDVARLQRELAREDVSAAVLADLESEQVVEIAGWELTRTECRVYALAALRG